MATVINTTPSPAQQPGLRAFIVCDRLPEGCVAYLVTDRWNEPLLRAGEWVIVDPEDTVPDHGELFVLQWQTGNVGPQVVVTNYMEKLGCWGVGGTKPIFAETADGPVLLQGARLGDFGYKTHQLQERIKGRVVGILEQNFEEPIRLI